METLMMCVWLFVICSLCYSLLTFIVMEFVIDYSQSKTPNGELGIKTKGFIVQKIYKGNAWRNQLLIPKNICQLFRGIFTGIIWFIILGAFMVIICLIATIFRIIQIPIAFILGYLPIYYKENFINILLDSDIDRFKPYQCRGKCNKKKWIAPWKIIVPAIMLIYYKITWETVVASVEFADSVLTTKATIYIGIAIILIVRLSSVVYTFRIKVVN